MAGTNPSLTFLAQVPLFAGCSAKELKKIAKAANEVTVDAGRVLVEEGEVGHEAFVILEGDAVITRSERTIATIGPGGHFGELALLDGGPRTATVVAQTPMTVLVLGQREFAALIDEVPGLARKVLARLAGQIRDLDTKVYA